MIQDYRSILVEQQKCESWIESLKVSLKEANKRLDDLYVELCKAKHGVEAGMIVEARTRKGVYEKCLVDRIYLDSKWADKPWIMVRQKKKNGEWSSLAINSYDAWRLIE